MVAEASLENNLGLDESKETSPPDKEAQATPSRGSANEFFIHKKRALRIQVGKTKDVVEGRYQIQHQEPFQRFDSDFAKAYRVVDLKDKSNVDIYCLIFDKRYPLRLSAINQLLAHEETGFSNVLAAELISLSSGEGNSFVAVVQKPKGISLMEYIKERGPLDEEFIVTRIVPTINQVLAFLHKRKVVHGAINLHNVYFDEHHQISVQECISEPCGFSQEPLYEHPYRAICLPAGKGLGDSKVDYFALGVLVNLLLLGGNPVVRMSKEELIQAKYMQGTYSMLARGMQLSPHMLDMLRGTINDKQSEIWESEQVQEWCKGRRFNLLPQANRTESSRALEFNGRMYSNRKHLANDFFLFWDIARDFLKQDKLHKWVERSMQMQELSEALLMVKNRAERDSLSPEMVSGDMLVAETILLLDPEGPLRLRGFATMIDGIGTLLALAFAHDKRDIKRNISYILSQGIISDWSAISPVLQGARYQEELFSLQKAADMINKNGLGFGLERCLYELAPSMVCQSSLVFEEGVFTVRQLLEFLDSTQKLSEELLDKQIAAFTSSRLELPSAIRVKSLSRFPDLANSIHIQSLALYALAQQREELPKLPGLAQKLQANLENIIDLFHSKTIRDDIRKNIKTPVKQGKLVNILTVITNANYVLRDKAGFNKARQQYRDKAIQLFNLSNRRAIANVGYRYGLQLSVILSFLIAAIVTLTLIIHTF